MEETLVASGDELAQGRWSRGTSWEPPAATHHMSPFAGAQLSEVSPRKAARSCDQDTHRLELRPSRSK